MSSEEQTKTNGIESRLDTAGIFVLMLSIILAVTAIVFSQDETYKQIGISNLLIGLGVGVFVMGIIYWIILRAGGEIVRLLKKLNNIEYDGMITGEKLKYTCDECGTEVLENAKFCTECGANFEEED